MMFPLSQDYSSKARFTLSRLQPVDARFGIRGESVDIGLKMHDRVNLSG